jgi:hypothetical protein
MMNEEDTFSLEMELARLQAENARLRATLDWLERERGQLPLAGPAPANRTIRGARAEKIRRLFIGTFWERRTQNGFSGFQMLFSIAMSTTFYALALVLTLAQAAPESSPARMPWGWVFVFVFASPLLLFILTPIISGYVQSRAQRTAQQRRARRAPRAR